LPKYNHLVKCECFAVVTWGGGRFDHIAITILHLNVFGPVGALAIVGRTDFDLLDNTLGGVGEFVVVPSPVSSIVWRLVQLFALSRYGQ
jgi:hypothetical protein